MKRSELFFSALTIPLDALALLCAFIVSYKLRDQPGPFSSTGHLPSLVNRFQRAPQEYIVHSTMNNLCYLSFVIPAILVIFAFMGLYALRRNPGWTKCFLRILVGVLAGECLTLSPLLLRDNFFLLRSAFFYSWILATLFVFFGRLIVNGFRRWLHNYNLDVIQVGLIGDNKAANEIAALVGSDRAYCLATQSGHLAVEEMIIKLRAVKLNELVVVNEHYNDGDLAILRNYCLEEAIAFSFVPSFMTQLQGSFDIKTLARVPVIEVSPTPLEGWRRVAKRFFDIIIGICLIILFSPFYLVIAIILKLTSPGPLIYSHQRIGKNRHPISIFKFRTMKWQYCTGVGGGGDRLFAELLESNPKLAGEWQQNHKLKDDPRVSTVGKILRKTSLDELPQFFNVLGGSLSLVGPRPIVQEEVSKYGAEARILFAVKPGVTGLWQVSGRNDTSYEERIEFDTFYIESWNIWMDVVILARTLGVIISRSSSGAY